LMIQDMVSLEAVAFYSVAFYVVSIINVPRNAIGNIAMPILAEAWAKKDLENVALIYEKSSLNQLLIGCLLFIGIWANHAWLFGLLPAEYANGKWVLFWIGMARLIDVGFGINGGILSITEYYKWETWFGLALVLISIVLNLMLIASHGIVGAAIATGLSLITVNMGRYLLIKVKLGIGPFSYRTLLILTIGIGAYWISTLMPHLANVHIDLIVRSAIIVAVYVPLAYVFKISEDANNFVKKLVKR
jgi:O-antigen/teichoic acid export membrane protein